MAQSSRLILEDDRYKKTHDKRQRQDKERKTNGPTTAERENVPVFSLASVEELVRFSRNKPELHY